MNKENDISVVLYGTDGCHLCLEAEQLLREIDYLSKTELVDIIDYPELVTTYGEQIPVLHHLPSNTALFWPFSAEQLTEFLKEHHGSSQN